MSKRGKKHMNPGLRKQQVTPRPKATGLTIRQEVQEIINHERQLVADTLDTFYIKKAIPYMIAMEHFTTLWCVAQAMVLTPGAKADVIRHWLAHKNAEKFTFKEEVNNTVAYLREREIALTGDAELEADENHPVLLGGELWKALTVFEETNPNTAKESDAIEALRVILNKQKSGITTRIEYSRNHINIGGRPSVITDWRLVIREMLNDYKDRHGKSTDRRQAANAVYAALKELNEKTEAQTTALKKIEEYQQSRQKEWYRSVWAAVDNTR